MDFWKRLKFYGIGFGMGLMIVYAIFGTRSCTTPNEMKMQELLFQHWEVSERALCKLKCMMKNAALLKIELRHFEVNYDLSSPRKKPCGEYFVTPKKDFIGQYGYKLVIYDCDTITRINDISITSSTVSCNCQ